MMAMMMYDVRDENGVISDGRRVIMMMGDMTDENGTDDG
jgi:hypothetical protein